MPKPAGLAIGRRVHFVMPDVGLKGEHRAADIVNVARGLNPEGRCNLIVMLDGPNDGLTVSNANDARNLFRYVENVPYSEDPMNGTWHFIERSEDG